MQTGQSGPSQAPPTPVMPTPQRLGPSPPQNSPEAHLPHLTRPPQMVSGTKPPFAFNFSQGAWQGPFVPASPPSPTMTKPPPFAPAPVKPLVPPTLASSSGPPGAFATSGLLPQPEAAAKVAKTTNRN